MLFTTTAFKTHHGGVLNMQGCVLQEWSSGRQQAVCSADECGQCSASATGGTRAALRDADQRIAAFQGMHHGRQQILLACIVDGFHCSPGHEKVLGANVFCQTAPCSLACQPHGLF